MNKKPSMRELSKSDWCFSLDDDGTLPSQMVAHVAYGSLQRIAVSLERIADLLDPKIIKENEKREAWSKIWDSWGPVRNASKRLEKKVLSHFLAVADLDLRKVLANGVINHLVPEDYWAWKRVGGDEEVAFVVGKMKSFDPSSFDWKSLPISGSGKWAKKAREFLAALGSPECQSTPPSPA